MSQAACSKQLRILSGTHAGATLDLGPGAHSLGARTDCDISLGDWRFEALVLRVDADGAVLAQWSDGAPHALRFDDFVPVDFAGVALCLGPTDADWPEPPRLLAALRPATVSPPPAARGLARIDRRLASWIAAGLGAVVTVGWLASAVSKPREAAQPTLASVHAELQRALQAQFGPRLDVQEARGTLVVDGMLDDAGQALAAGRTIDAVAAPFPARRHIAVASEVKETIRSALGLPGARIEYRGGGVFALTVRTDDVAATRAAVDRVAADLAPAVRRIDAVFDEPPAPRPPMPAVLSALVTDDGLDVLETRDGVKHLVMGNPMPYPAPASEPDSSDPAAGVPRQPGTQP